MKHLLTALLLLTSALAFAQTPAPATPTTPAIANIYAAGISFNNAGSPAIAGTLLYSHLLSDGSGTYAFTAVDALPNTLKPFTVTSNFSTGIAQKLFSFGKYSVYVPTSAGVSYNGTNTGWTWSTGALVPVKIKGGFHIFPNVRVVKSSVSNGTGYQPVVGILFGFAK